MRIVIDECVNPRLREELTGHEVVLVVESSWRALPDHELLSQLQGRCDAFLTIDRGFASQHNHSLLTFGIVILLAGKNRMEHFRPLLPKLHSALEEIEPGRVIVVSP